MKKVTKIGAKRPVKKLGTYKGTKPACITGIATVAKVAAGIITSSPSCRLYFSFNARSANKLADEPELTAIPK